MLAGRFNRRVLLQEQQNVQDTFGQPVTLWQDIATIFADVRHKSGMESIKGGAITSINQASIRVRYREDIKPGMRFLYNLQSYNIRAVLPDVAGRQYVDCVCEVL